MKFLLVSDLHYALKQYDWTAEAASGFDVVVIAGDHLDISGQLDGSVQIVVLLKQLQRMAKATRLIVSSGNHDLDRRDATGEKVASWMERVRRLGIPTDGDSIDFDGTLVSVCPWWDGPVARAAVDAQLARDAARPKTAWVWVYHAPPDGSPTSWDGRRHWGDADLNTWIAQHGPDAVFCGHIHQAPFKRGGSWVDRIGETWVFNAGNQIGPTPAHVAVNLGAREAAWVSLAGVEMVRLDGPPERIDLAAPPAWMSGLQ